MVSRTNRQTGQVFWGCRAYPKCTGTRDTDGESREERMREEAETRLPSERRHEADRGRWGRW